jgi:hypothetical protein
MRFIEFLLEIYLSVADSRLLFGTFAPQVDVKLN